MMYTYIHVIFFCSKIYLGNEGRAAIFKSLLPDLVEFIVWMEVIIKWDKVFIFTQRR